MKFRGCCIFLLSWTLWAVVSCGMLLKDSSVQNVLTTHCDRPRQHTVTATDDPHTITVRHARSLGATPRVTPDGKAQNMSKPAERSAECDVWTVISEDGQSELILLVSSVDFQPRDLLFICSDSPSETIGYDFNLTDLDPFPKDLRSKDRFVLVWARYPVVGETAASGKQTLAFSYWIRRSKASVEEKEKVVLMGAIVISIFTVIATVISVTRASKCQCVRKAVIYLKSRKRDVFTSRGGASGRTGIDDARQASSGEEVSLMIVNQSRHHLGVASYLEDPGMNHASVPSSSLDQQQRAEVGGDRQRALGVEAGNLNVGVACSRMIALEASREEALSQDGLDVPETSSPAMSALIGLLPPTSGSLTVPPPSCHRPSSLSQLASLIQSRLRGRPLVFPAHPPNRECSPPSGVGGGFGGGAVVPFASSGPISGNSLPPNHAPGTVYFFNTNRTRSDVSERDVLPSYSELPPPRYSLLFPNGT